MVIKMPGSPDLFCGESLCERLKRVSINAYTEMLREELEGMDAVELAAYRRENAPKGRFDLLCYLFDPVRQARVNTSESLLDEYFPGILKGIELLSF